MRLITCEVYRDAVLPFSSALPPFLLHFFFEVPQYRLRILHDYQEIDP